MLSVALWIALAAGGLVLLVLLVRVAIAVGR